MARTHNFSAGPGVLPEAVIRQAQTDLWDHDGTGIGVVECSHRWPQFDRVIGSARARIRNLLALDDDQVILFLHGGARSQFYQLPMNLLGGGRATYLDTGRWSAFAIEDARRFGTIDVPFSSADTGYDRLPPNETIGVHADSVYLHYTSNNTVAGAQFDWVPTPQHGWLACDMSSDFLSRPIDGSRFGFIYAGAQKNVGPSGCTVVVVRRSLLVNASTDLPGMLRYSVQVDKGSMLNTPCTFSIYMIDQVCGWIEDQGGLEAIDAHNRSQASRIYGAIDGSGFWQGKVSREARSLMNVTFTTGSDALDARFVSEADDAGLLGLKGHRAVGGLRASVYNAQTDAAVDALVAFMNQFESDNG